MKVEISVGGRFWGYDLTSQLLKHGHDVRLFASHLPSTASRYGIPNDRVCNYLAKEVLVQGWRRAPRFVRGLWNPLFPAAELFDRHVARHIAPCDVFTGWSGFSLHTLRKLRNRAKVRVLERGSTHIEWQDELLREEYDAVGIVPDEQYSFAPRRLVEKELMEYEEADVICLPSHFTRRTFIERGFSEDRLLHIPFGVDLRRFQPTAKEDSVFRVLFVGNACVRKGVHHLLNALSSLDLHGAELLLVGMISDEVRPLIGQYAGRLKNLSHVSHQEMGAIMGQASVLVLPSLEEGLARVIPEAMACGLPVVATTNTGAEDVVRDGEDGYIVPIRDVEILQDRLLRLYENAELRDEMGKNAVLRVSSGFSWDDYGDKVNREYCRLMALAGERAMGVDG